MPVPFLEARAGACRFPVEGEGLSLIVCGASAAPASSYCPACRARAYQRTPPARVLSRYLSCSAPAPDRQERTPDLVEAMS